MGRPLAAGDYVVGVYNASATAPVSSSGSAPAWTAMMRDIYDRRAMPTDPWPRPDSLVIAEIDKSTGELAWPYCPRELHFVESYIPGTEPKEYCHVHGLNPLGGSPLTGAPSP